MNKFISILLASGLLFSQTITLGAAASGTTPGGASSGGFIISSGGQPNKEWITASDWAWNPSKSTSTAT